MKINNGTMNLVEPTPQATRSALADWVELTAITSDRRLVSEASLISIFDQYADDEDLLRKDLETDETVDEGILQSDQDLYVDSVAAEITYRHGVLNGHYPFTVDLRGILLSFNKNESKLTIGEWVYLFCLLSSAIREGVLQPRNSPFEKRIPELFQVCACLAAAGYLTGSVSSFGFPRAAGNAFLPALTATYSRFGEGRVRSKVEIPPGYPTELKDGGIDIIAWRDHPDKMPGKIYLLGQCASGINWRSKTVKQYIPQFNGLWFTSQPPSIPITAMFIPFTVHHELVSSEDTDFLELLRNLITSETFRFGLVQDRLRISYFAEVGSGLPNRAEIDLCDEIKQVKSWVVEVLEAIRGSKG